MIMTEMLPRVLSAILESTTDMSFVKDINLRYVCASRTFVNLVGLGDERELTGKTDYDIFPFDLAEKYRADDEKLISGKKALVDMVEEIPSDDDTPRYSSTSKYLLRDSTGNIIGLYGHGRDITQALETDSQLRLLTNSIPGGIAEYEFDSADAANIRLTYFSDGLCRLFGYTREEYEKLSSRNPMGQVFEEYRAMLLGQVKTLLSENRPVDCVYRAHTCDGGHIWINLKAVTGDRLGDRITASAVFFDVTVQQNALEQLRISEERNRLALRHSGNIIGHYAVDSRTLTVLPEVAKDNGIPDSVSDVPFGPVKDGMIAPESVDEYIGMFNDINSGRTDGVAVYKERFRNKWRWMEARYSTIKSSDGRAVSAVLSFHDITDRLEKEAVYKTWQQSFLEKKPESYTWLRCNLSKNLPSHASDGSLLYFDTKKAVGSFDGQVAEYIRECVFDDDFDKVTAFLNSDVMIANYYRGKRSAMLEYREKLPAGGYRWLRLGIDMLEYPNSTDIEVYLMFEDIDAGKRAELLTLERAETDPLTGILNRQSFAAKADDIMKNSRPETLHALFMMDIDFFKMVNDTFGHGAGDQALTDITNLLRPILRRNDLFGRLGGDEFLIFLSDIPNETVAANKARQICALVRKSYSIDVQISASIGIAFAPRDGNDFETLYRKSDTALYYVKGSGKDNYSFYQEGLENNRPLPAEETAAVTDTVAAKKKRRILIVDDNHVDFAMMANIFRDEFTIERAKDGNSAMTLLRYFGSALSAVLLDLIMPGIDGFAVLDKMRIDPTLRTIPVVVVSGADDRETSLRAIRCGASDFVLKPIDPEVLRVRVKSAVSKADNDRLRAQNSFLELQNDEIVKYRAAIDGTGIAVIENDWLSGSFTYNAAVSERLAGTYDDRNFWYILLSDMVGDTATVQKMQELVHSVAEDRSREDGCMTVVLRTPTRAKHRFHMTVTKLNNDYKVTSKLIITLLDIDFGSDGNSGAIPEQST